MAYVHRPATRRRRTATRTALIVGLIVVGAGYALIRIVETDPGLSAGDWFEALWSLLLIPLTWLFGRVVNSRLEARAGGQAPPATPQDVFDTARAAAVAEATASATAHAQASAAARADATAGRGGETDDPWQVLIMGVIALAAVCAVLSVVGVFFAGVRVLAVSFTAALYALVAGYALACLQTLRREGALDGAWLAILSLAGCICLTVFAGGVLAVEPTLTAGRYGEMALYFDRFGRDGLEGFGLMTSSVYLGVQGLGLIVLSGVAGWLLIQLSGLMAMRYEAQIGLLSRARLAVRTAALGPYGSPLLVWLLVVVPLALLLSGLPYNWTFEASREAVDWKAPTVRKLEVTRTADPVLRYATDEVGTAEVIVHRLRRGQPPVEVARRAFAVLPGEVSIAMRSVGTLRRGSHRVTLVARDEADNRAPAKRLVFAGPRGRGSAASRR